MEVFLETSGNDLRVPVTIGTSSACTFHVLSKSTRNIFHLHYLISRPHLSTLMRIFKIILIVWSSAFSDSVSINRQVQQEIHTLIFQYILRLLRKCAREVLLRLHNSDYYYYWYIFLICYLIKSFSKSLNLGLRNVVFI